MFLALPYYPGGVPRRTCQRSIDTFRRSPIGSQDAILVTVFAGYGVTSVDPKYDDYPGVDVAGKVVLVLSETPRKGHPHADVFAAAANVRIRCLIVVTAVLRRLYDADIRNDDTRALIVHWPEVGKNREGGAEVERLLTPGQAQRAVPAQPQLLESRHPAAHHLKREQYRAASAGERHSYSPVVLARDER